MLQRTLPAGFIALCLQLDWARRLVASARSSALRTNGTSRIWSNSHFRREAFALFSKRLKRSIVNDAFRSAAAGVDTRSTHSIFDSASPTPPLRMICQRCDQHRRIVTYSVPTSCAMTLPSICAPSPIRRSEARNSPLIRPKTCAGPLHSMLPTIDIPEPMQERVAAFVVGSRLSGGRSTTDCCWCTVLPTISAAFAATSLSFSGALLLNMPTSVCRLGVHCGKAKLRALIDCPLCEIGCAGISGPALGETQRPLGPSDPSEAWVGIPE